MQSDDRNKKKTGQRLGLNLPCPRSPGWMGEQSGVHLYSICTLNILLNSFWMWSYHSPTWSTRTCPAFLKSSGLKSTKLEAWPTSKNMSTNRSGNWRGSQRGFLETRSSSSCSMNGYVSTLRPVWGPRGKSLKQPLPFRLLSSSVIRLGDF